jgi:hypothetical protein
MNVKGKNNKIEIFYRNMLHQHYLYQIIYLPIKVNLWIMGWEIPVIQYLRNDACKLGRWPTGQYLLDQPQFTSFRSQKTP